jgi:hypothetical protein
MVSGVSLGCDDDDASREVVDVNLTAADVQNKKSCSTAGKTHTFSHPTPHAQLNQFVIPARTTAIGICDIAT